MTSLKAPPPTPQADAVADEADPAAVTAAGRFARSLAREFMTVDPLFARPGEDTAAFSPPLDMFGHSVRGQLAISRVAAELELNLDQREPQGPPGNDFSPRPVPPTCHLQARLRRAAELHDGAGAALAERGECARLPGQHRLLLAVARSDHQRHSRARTGGGGTR